ncbi:MAG: transcriptional regulator [Bacteriovorax sp.]|nr:transcriptional regulator [Bacteriovorax sp.]
MKLKKAKIIIKSIKEVKLEWSKALRGQVKMVQKKDEIIFTSLEAASKVFTKGRMEILQTIMKENPRSIYDLAKILEKDFKNVYTDVKFLSEIGLIELKESKNSKNGLKPVARFSGIELDWAA